MEKVTQRTATTYEVNDQAASQTVSKTSIGVFMTAAGLIGAWGMACMVGGIVSAGGIGQFARSWFIAVTGM